MTKEQIKFRIDFLREDHYIKALDVSYTYNDLLDIRKEIKELKEL